MEEVVSRDTGWGLSQRLTPILASGGFTAVPSTFLDHYSDLNITSGEAMVIIHLLSYKWGARKPFPRLRLLAKKMGLTETSVRTHIRKLEEKRILRRVARPGHSNAFDLAPLFEQLEERLRQQNSSRPRQHGGDAS